MKRVGIVTIQSINFGNRLQNYALQESIKRLGYDVYSFRRYDENLTLKENIVRIFKIILQYVVVGKIWNYRCFDRNIKFSKFKIGVDKTPDDLSDSFDYFVAGSDQIWNPYFKSCGKCNLLSFASYNKRISYAASFGISTFPEEYRVQYSNELKKYKSLSVRETTGSIIVEDLIGKSAKVVLDPTFLLSADEWKKVQRSTKYRPKNKYCFVYSLNKRSEEFKRKIEQFSKEYVIVDIMKKNRFGISKRIGPAEFLYLIDHADVVLTNSFHATVFAVIFRKDVLAFDRIDVDMSSRIRTLATILGLNNNFDEYGTFSIYTDGDKDIAEANIKIEIDKSFDFLKKALDANN